MGTRRRGRGQNIGNECVGELGSGGESRTGWGVWRLFCLEGNGGRGVGKVCAGEGGRCKKRVEFWQNIQRLNIWGLRWAGVSSGQLDEKVPVIN